MISPLGLFDTSCLEVVCGTGVLTTEVPQSCDGVLYLESFETTKAIKMIINKAQSLNPFLTCLSLSELSMATRKRSEHKSNLTVAAHILKIAEQVAKQDQYKVLFRLPLLLAIVAIYLNSNQLSS